MDFSKLKVTELKAELESRDLDTKVLPVVPTSCSPASSRGKRVSLDRPQWDARSSIVEAQVPGFTCFWDVTSQLNFKSKNNPMGFTAC